MDLRSLKFPEQREQWSVPAGYGFHRCSLPELKEMTSLLGTFQIWERPRRHQRYVLGVDVSDGIGQDDSVVDVVRMGTVEEPEEQVAQFISDTTTPKALAYVVQAIGSLYRWPDGQEALAAIECNNHGLSCQDTLQLHLGYRHFYIWEVLDQADPSKRFTTRMGWMTTPRTRPILLDQLRDAVTEIDPLSNHSSLRVNSRFTIDEMRDFQTEGALWEAEAARGAKDDCIISLGIAHYVAWRLQAGEREPLEDRRRRRQEEALRRSRMTPVKFDFRNSDTTAEEAKDAGPLTEEQDDERDEQLWHDPTGRGTGGTLY